MSKCSLCNRTTFQDWHSYNSHMKITHGVDMDRQQFRAVVAVPRRPVSEVAAEVERRMAAFIIGGDVRPAKVDPWDHAMRCLDAMEASFGVLEAELLGAAPLEKIAEPGYAQDVEIPWLERFPQ